MKSGRISPSHEGWTGPELILVEYYEYQGDLMSADNPFIAGCAVYPLTADALVRGAMVIIYGLVGKPELNHRHGLVVGPDDLPVVAGAAPSWDESGLGVVSFVLGEQGVPAVGCGMPVVADGLVLVPLFLVEALVELQEGVLGLCLG